MRTKVMMQKRFVFLLIFVAYIATTMCSNSKSHCEALINLAKKEGGNQNYVKSLEYLIEAKIIAKEDKLYDIQIDILNAMGLIYSDILDYEKAIESYLEAYQMALDKSDKTSEIMLLSNTAQLYYNSNDLDKSKKYLDNAYKIAIELKDSLFMIRILNNMATISNEKRDLEQTKTYINTAKEILKNNPQDLIGDVFIKYIEIEYLYLKKEYDLAEQQALETINQVIGKKYQELEVSYFFILSKIYFEKKDFTQAISYAKEALKTSFILPTTIEIYEHLSKIYSVTNEHILVSQYQDSVIMLKDSLLRRNNTSQILRGQIQFDLNNLEKEMIKNKAKQRRLQFTVISIVVLFLLLLYIRHIKSKQVKTLAEMQRKIHENEMEQKNKEIVSKTLLQLSKNNQIEEIITMLSNAPNQGENMELQSIIQKLRSQLKNPVDENWNSFLTYFEQTHSAFLSSLKAKHHDLTADDIRLSSYIYLHLNTKEIANLLNITPEYCKKKKRHLAQKMKLPPATIHNYLSNIG